MFDFSVLSETVKYQAMIELPEALVLSQEINDALSGKTIRNVIAGKSPHKFAWFHEDPKAYNDRLAGKTIRSAKHQGGMVEVSIDDIFLVFSEGIRLKYFHPGEITPDKHQLFVEFSDESSLVATVQMYGGLVAFKEGEMTNKYYLGAREKPSPFSDRFDSAYFDQLFSSSPDNISLKAFLATEQRIPGLGNGVLQDILFNTNLHPKKKINTLKDKDKEEIFLTVKSTLTKMADQGGRDTEQDIFGVSGGYHCILCKNTVDHPCPKCGTTIKKMAYMGGSVYVCEKCQKI